METLAQWVRILICKIVGCDYEAYGDAESGKEEVWCNRCGWGFSCYH